MHTVTTRHSLVRFRAASLYRNSTPRSVIIIKFFIHFAKQSMFLSESHYMNRQEIVVKPSGNSPLVSTGKIDKKHDYLGRLINCIIHQICSFYNLSQYFLAEKHLSNSSKIISAQKALAISALVISPTKVSRMTTFSDKQLASLDALAALGLSYSKFPKDLH